MQFVNFRFFDSIVFGALVGALTCVALLGNDAHAAIDSAAAAMPSARYALAAPAARVGVQGTSVDRDREIAADIAQPKSAPLRYAVERTVADIRTVPQQSTQGGEWRDLAGGMALWRIPVHVPNALSLDFVFRRFFLPPGAHLYIGNGTQTLGPYSDSDNTRSRRFATPLIGGDSAQIEVLLPQTMKPFLELELTTVNAGYRDIFAAKSLLSAGTGSGSCNVDTICSQGDLWRSQINAEAVVVANRTFCSGQLVNNTRGDRTPLLTTAHHCFADQSAGDVLVVYWKYESPTCRAPGSAANAAPVPVSYATAQTGGAQLLATDADSDFTLFRLEQAPPQSANIYFNGWDTSAEAFSDGIVFHHPGADAKRLSLPAGSIVVDDTDYRNDGDDSIPGLHHWRVDHYALGTTEAGSSGGGLLDANHRLRGVLSGGEAACSDPTGKDEYGRLSAAWEGGGSPSSRLKDWLDPDATGKTQSDGIGSCTPPTVDLNLSASTIAAGQTLTLNAAASGGTAPYSYAFDVDGDGVADSTDPTQSSIPAIYSSAFSGNVGVSVTDSTGCTGSASRALIVQAPQISASTASTPAAGLLCGANAANFNPGDRRSAFVTLKNNGNAATQNGYAVFAQDPATLAQSRLILETPAVAIPAIAPGQSARVELDYAIDASNTCGAPVQIDYLGSVDDHGFNAAQATIVNTTISANCRSTTTCKAQTTPLPLADGNYADLARGGNGIELGVPPATPDRGFFATWFTGDASRQPTWYVLQGTFIGNQVQSPLYRDQQTVPPAWPLQPSLAGAAQITLIDENKFIFTFSLAGQAGGAVFSSLVGASSTVTFLYSPNESGWGTYNQLIETGAALPILIGAVSIYDGVGNPRWLLANNGDNYQSGNVLDLISYRPTCPGCVWLDYRAGMQSAGTMTYMNSAGNVQISTNINLPAAIPGTWLRNQLPFVTLYSTP